METLDVLQEPGTWTNDAEVLVEQRMPPGIVMLTPTIQLLHVDRRAWDLCGLINKANGKNANGVLPTAVTDLCLEIVQTLRERTAAKDWEQFQVRRMCAGANRPVLLRGFGLPDPRDFQQSRVLIMLEEIARRQRSCTQQAKERFQLTEREYVVVQKLSHGLTNKEIAMELGIAEQTVKEHIKHIMQKTKSSTRTGILVRVLSS